MEKGQSVEIVVDLPRKVCQELTVEMGSPFDEVMVPISHIEPITDSQLSKLYCEVPPDLQNGLYDIQIEWQGGMDTMPSAVQVLNEKPTDFQFIHIGDPHVAASLTEKPGEGLRQVVNQINLLNPDFVLLTGDLISRYGDDDEVLCSNVVRNDMIHAQQLLRKIQVPLFITAGNHDLAYPWIRQLYRRYIGRPVKSHHLNYSFNYGDVTFLTYEGFQYYDDDPPGTTDVSPTPDQTDWLQTELAAAQTSSLRILFYHYDYDDTLPEIFDEYNVDLALYGHTSPLIDEEIGTTPTRTIMEEDVFEHGHFRLLEIRDGELVRLPYFNDEVLPGGQAIDCSFSRSNDGTHSTNEAVISNHTNQKFPDVRIIFNMRPGKYSIRNGTCVQTSEHDNTRNLHDVRVTLPPNDSRRIRIERDQEIKN